MTSLPTIQPDGGGPQRNRTPKRIAIHAVRILLFVAVISLIHLQHLKLSAQRQARPFAPVQLAQLKKFFPNASSISEVAGSDQSRSVLDEAGNSLGYVIQTSPDSDRIIGFSGPTNTMIAFSAEGIILGLDVLYSGDTRDHVQQVIEEESFFSSYAGSTAEEAVNATSVDAVSGATLTSLAIAESVIVRLSGDGGQSLASLRFPDPLTIDNGKRLFPKAAAIEQDSQFVSVWHVKDASGAALGSVFRTSPMADNIVGYQGPTDSLVGFNLDGKAIGISLGQSYDNEPYVSYVREDEYFLNLLNDSTLETLAKLDLEAAGIDGVSGATMTSQSIARGIQEAAASHQKAIVRTVNQRQAIKPILNWTYRDLGTGVVILFGLAIAFTSLRGNKMVRFCFQVVLIGYLGLVNGDLISQAMVVGWAKSGVPWSSAGGLVLLTLAAFLVPMTTKRNVYCTHLCPHGAAQHLLMNRLPWRYQLPGSIARWLKFIPVVLLAWSVIVAMTSLTFSLVDVEPFDAWVFRVAGWATISVAIIGLVASLFVPMAYCKFGCPTGALLSFFRFNSRSDHWSRRDWFAILLVALAVGLWAV